jgi:hypothetical protein
MCYLYSRSCAFVRRIFQIKKDGCNYNPKKRIHFEDFEISITTYIVAEYYYASSYSSARFASVNIRLLGVATPFMFSFFRGRAGRYSKAREY